MTGVVDASLSNKALVVLGLLVELSCRHSMFMDLIRT